MKPLLSVLLFLISAHVFSQSKTSWISDSLRSKGLDGKFEFSSYISPVYLQTDLNGDSYPDLAILIVEKKTRKKGILLFPGHSTLYYVFGAGTKFGDGSDDFSWINKWSVFSGKKAQETQFDKKSGDIIRGKEIKLKHSCLLLAAMEDGAEVSGGLIYWNGAKYIWIHQGE
jgi:hypothetical protein